jgi:hypothetical protein
VAGQPAPLTYDELLRLAERFAGQTLETVTGKRFTVELSPAKNCPVFLGSSGKRQTGGCKAAERVVERYNETHSLRPRDYEDVTRNASYYVGLLLRRDA